MKLHYVLSFLLLYIICISVSGTTGRNNLMSGANNTICNFNGVYENSIHGVNSTKTYCDVNSVTISGTKASVCLETKVDAKKECTVLRVNDDQNQTLALPCVNKSAVINDGEYYELTAGLNGTKTCQNYTSNTGLHEFCVQAKTDKTSKCTTVEYKGTVIFTTCSCILFNKWEVKVLQKGPNCNRVTENDDDIQIHYRAVNLENGKEFDNSYYNNIPVDVKLGTVQFMKGWDLGLLGMCEGEVRHLTIPYKLGTTDNILTYPDGSPHPYIQDGDTLSFEIKLIKIVIPSEDL